MTTWWQQWDLLPKADVACRQIHVQHDDERHKAAGEGGGEQLSASRIGGNGEYLKGCDQVAPGATEDTARTTARGRTNSKGERKCFQCNKFGHIAVNCPTREVSGASGVAKGLSARACDEIAWNAESRKFVRRGKLDGRCLQILLDTGCDQTMVLASLVDPSVVDHVSKVPVLRVHGDTLFYPTATVEL